MDVESFEMREVSEVVIKFNKIIMRDVDPLKIVAVFHNSWKHTIETWELSYFVVTKHEWDADKLDLNTFFLFFLEFFFGFTGYILHCWGVNHCWNYCVEVTLGDQFDYLLFFLACFVLSFLTLCSVLFLFILLFDFLCIFLLSWGCFLSLSRLYFFEF